MKKGAIEAIQNGRVKAENMFQILGNFNGDWEIAVAMVASGALNEEPLLALLRKVNGCWVVARAIIFSRKVPTNNFPEILKLSKHHPMVSCLAIQ